MDERRFLISPTALKEGENFFNFDIPPELLSELIDVKKMKPVSNLIYNIKLTKKETEIIFEAVIKGEIELLCSMCAEPFRKKINQKINLIHIKGTLPMFHEPIELSGHELNEEYYQDKINLLKPMIDTLLLEIPIAPVCKENCKGLCPICGTNLNIKQCKCQGKRPESPFLVLKDIINDEKKKNSY